MSNNILNSIEKIDHSGDDYVDMSKTFVKINEIIVTLNDCVKELNKINRIISNPFLCSLPSLIK